MISKMILTAIYSRVMTPNHTKTANKIQINKCIFLKNTADTLKMKVKNVNVVLIKRVIPNVKKNNF